MDTSDISMSLQSIVNLSSSDKEDKDVVLHPLKRNKTLQPKPAKKSRVRKVKDRLAKTTKRYGKSYGAYQSKNYERGNGVIHEDSNQGYLEDSSTTDHLFEVVHILEKYNFKYEVKPDISKKQGDFFLQDVYMSTFFRVYPEYICVDLLCEIIELELNLYLFISVDTNGLCEIVSIGLCGPNEASLLWLCEVFKKHNIHWRKIKIVMSDRKARCNELLKVAFPEKIVMLSFFHSMKSLKKDLLNLDYNITEEDINKVLQIFEQMIFALDESNYAELLKQLKMMPPAISTYFRKVWHQKKDYWALSQQLNSKLFLKSYNVYLNFIRKIIRPAISTLDSIQKVVQALCTVLEKMRLEKFQNFTSVFRVTSISNKQFVCLKYSKILTAYATELISEQINNSIDVKNMKKLAPGKYICSSEDIATINACSCNFFQLLSLPCCHIFCVRKFLSLPLYAESLCSLSWISVNYRNMFINLQNTFSEEFKKSNAQKASQLDGFQKYFTLSAELWPFLVGCSENISNDRLQILKNLLDAWQHGIRVSVKTSDLQRESSNIIVPMDVPSGDFKDMHAISLTDILDSDNDISDLHLLV